jgi:hypothetical protein
MKTKEAHNRKFAKISALTFFSAWAKPFSSSGVLSGIARGSETGNYHFRMRQPGPHRYGQKKDSLNAGNPTECFARMLHRATVEI